MNILLFIMIVTAGLTSEQHADIKRIEFNSTTRGYQEHIVITADSIVTSRTNPDDRSKFINAAAKISGPEWKGLVKDFPSISWKDYDNLKSPTNKRAYDGARHSVIMVTLTIGETHSHVFDNEEPNEKLTVVMQCIQKLKAKLK